MQPLPQDQEMRSYFSIARMKLKSGKSIRVAAASPRSKRSPRRAESQVTAAGVTKKSKTAAHSGMSIANEDARNLLYATRPAILAKNMVKRSGERGQEQRLMSPAGTFTYSPVEAWNAAPARSPRKASHRLDPTAILERSFVTSSDYMYRRELLCPCGSPKVTVGDSKLTGIDEQLSLFEPCRACAFELSGQKDENELCLRRKKEEVDEWLVSPSHVPKDYEGGGGERF